MLDPQETADSANSNSDSEAEAGGEAGGEPSDASSGRTADAGESSAGGGAADSERAAESGGQAGASAAASTAGVPTSELDRELNNSLEGFEGDMQERMIIIASNRPPAELEGDEPAPSGGEEQTGEEAGESGDGGGTPGLVRVEDPSQLPPAAGERGSGRTATSGTIQEDGGMPGTASQREGSNRDAMVSSRVPSDIGDGSDDDVVARQIREAAMNEADPVLREKLWEEYRNYKKAIR